MSGFKSVTKRKRELAKLDKRQAKDQKRALRKAARQTGPEASAPAVAPVAPVPQPTVPHVRPLAAPPVAKQPLTLAEAVERWRNTKVAKPKRR
jgi:hypothetical protein